MGAAKLTILTGNQKGQVLEIAKPQFSIGRGPANDLSIPQDKKCSRKHAVIFKKAENLYQILSLNDQNYVVIENRGIIKKTLKSGHQIQIGDTVLLFEQDGMPAQAFNPDLQNEPLDSNPTQNKDNSRVRFYVILFLILGGAYFLLSSPTKKKATQEIRTSENIESDIKSIEEKISAQKAATEYQQTVDFKNANIAYIKGFRDYKRGFYGRAVEFFRVCKTLYPKHELCGTYITKATIKQQHIIESNMILGKKYRDKNHFKACLAAFNTVLTLVQNTNHPTYKEAKSNYNYCKLEFESGRY